MVSRHRHRNKAVVYYFHLGSPTQLMNTQSCFVEGAKFRGLLALQIVKTIFLAIYLAR